MTDTKQETKLPVLRLFCGNNTPVKRYIAHFKGKLDLVENSLTSKNETCVALCHSLGIVEALESNVKYIVAMDPTILSDDTRVANWVPIHKLPTKLGNVISYAMPKGMEELKGFVISVQVPESETAGGIREHFKDKIPEGVRIGVSADQFYTFDRTHKVSNIDHTCVHLEDMEYLYVTRSADASAETPIPIPCKARKACFEVVENTTSDKRLSLFGQNLYKYVKSSGGSLYKNTRCFHQSLPWTITAEEWLQKKSQ